MMVQVAGYALAVAAVLGGADGAAMRAEVQAALAAVEEEVGTATPPICHEILKTTWWQARRVLKPDIAFQPTDQACSIWSQDRFGTRDVCNQRDTRQEEEAHNRAAYTTEQWNAACTVRGAHDHTCISNPCNSLNTGDCNLNNTEGQCVWLNSHAINLMNQQRSSGRTPLTPNGLIPNQEGCYRNPCNIPGSGKQNQNSCGALSVPGLFECAYCAGANDNALRGQGMGCQLTTLEWPIAAECRPVNGRSVPRNSIFEIRSAPTCQCSDTQYTCSRAIQNRAADFVRRFP